MTLTDNVGGLAIADNNCEDANFGTGLGGVTRQIQITEVGTVTDVDVAVAVSHPWRSDLQMGIAYTPTDGAPLPAITLANIHDLNGLNYYATFDSDAVTACSAGAACGGTSHCTAAPGPTCGPDASLDVFDGASAPGTFVFSVCDGASDDLGTLDAWSVTVSTVGSGPTPTPGPIPTSGPTSTPGPSMPRIPTLSGLGVGLLALLLSLAALVLSRTHRS